MKESREKRLLGRGRDRNFRARGLLGCRAGVARDGHPYKGPTYLLGDEAAHAGCVRSQEAGSGFQGNGDFVAFWDGYTACSGLPGDGKSRGKIKHCADNQCLIESGDERDYQRTNGAAD